MEPGVCVCIHGLIGIYEGDRASLADQIAACRRSIPEGLCQYAQ